MNAENQIYVANYALHRLFYETPEESRDADFWLQIKAGIAEVTKNPAQCTIARTLIRDVLTPYEQYSTREQLRKDSERAEIARKAQEEAERAETQKRRLAEIERLERELAQARAEL